METFHISAKKVARFLISIVIVLTIASFAASFAHNVLGITLRGLVSRLDVGVDSSLPTWYSSITLLICALLLLLIGFIARKTRQPYVIHWFTLSALFTYISVDEVATLRETFFRALKPIIHTDGVFQYRWTLFAIPFVIFFSLSYLKFLTHLPKQIRRLFILSGIVFIFGALGMEMMASLTDSLYGTQNMLYVAITVVEEFCEMVGIVIFIYTLLSYLQMQGIHEIRLCLTQNRQNQSLLKDRVRQN
jgi:hypothetical protein